jgi:hypothetical protein
MPKAIVKELEHSILTLPQKEKDRLLLRLISQKPILIEQLHYKLLEDPVLDLEERFQQAKADISTLIFISKGQKEKAMLQNIRKANATITHHKRITSDKIGEVRLAVFLVDCVLETNKLVFVQGNFSFYYEKAYTYILKKVLAILKLIEKLHEDYFIEFESDLNRILHNINNGLMAPLAKQLSIPKEFSF